MIGYVRNITHFKCRRCKFLDFHPHKLHLLYSCPILSNLDVYFVMILLLHAVPAPIWYHTIFGKMIAYVGNITHFQWRRCKFLEFHPHKMHLLYSCPIISNLDVYFVMILLLHAVPAPIWYHTIFGKMITYVGNITHFQWK